MPDFNMNYDTTALKICIDELSEGKLVGWVYGQRLIEPIRFNDISDLLLQLEDVLDLQNYPQAFQEKRSFNKAMKKTEPPEGDYSPHYMDETMVNDAQGKLITFILRVTLRQNTTWQGQLDWLDGNPLEQFNSDLELIALIDSHLSS